MREANGFKLAQEFVFWLIVIVAILIVSLYVPLAGLLISGVIAAPLAVFTLRYGVKFGGGLVLSATVFLGLFFGMGVGLGFLCEFGFLSQVIAFGLKNSVPQEKIILAGFVASVLVMLLFIAGLAASIEDGTLSGYIKKQIDENISQSMKVYEDMEVDGDKKEFLEQIEQTSEVLKDFLSRAYIGLYAGISLLIVVANCFSSKFLLFKLGYPLTDDHPFSELSWPEFLVWGFIGSASLFVLTLLPSTNIVFIHNVGLNLTLIFVSFYLVQGLAILFYVGARSRIPVVLKWVGLFLVIVQPVFLIIVSVTGVFDIWFDFRKLKQQPVT